MTFVCIIALRNKTVAHTDTFFPPFDNANRRLSQQRLLRSRHFATMLTWRHTSHLFWNLGTFLVFSKNKSLRLPTTPKKSLHQKLTPQKIPCRFYTPIILICRLLFGQATQGKYSPNFPTQKNPGIENLTPQKQFFNHPCHLKSGVRKSVVVLLR